MDTLTIVGMAMAAYTVYRICKKCWRSTAHDTFRDEDGGSTTYRCRECGFQFKEKDHD